MAPPACGVSEPPFMFPPLAAQLARRARLRGALGLLRIATACSRQVSRLTALTSGLVTQAIEPSDRGTVTAAVYSFRGSNRRDLFRWEEPWFTSDLPKPPARILVGGAGDGREARWLLARGYDVIAFDPARASVAQYNASFPETPSIVLDYETLSRASYARRTGSHIELEHDAAPILERAPYDAAVLGWGSLTHVLEEHEQAALFETLVELVPVGPILASFFMRQDITADVPNARGRAHQLGIRLGMALSGGRVLLDVDAPGQPRFMPHCGFVYHFDCERLERLAAICGRELTLYATNTYPHATFR
jgi:hypothetical protein